MKLLKISILFFAIISFSKLFACSIICIPNNETYILGANFDGEGNWDGLIFINKRNKSKTSDQYNTGELKLQWISKYGNITFNAISIEYPQYGMNEAGLVISTVALPHTIGPPADERPAMICNFWVQYALDNCKTTQEVLESLSKIRIINSSDKYMICDKYGGCLIISFQNGKIVSLQNEELPIKVLTNQEYSKCLNHFNENTLPEKSNVFDYITTQRFVLAADQLAELNCETTDCKIDYTFDILKSIEGSPESIWRIVFDPYDQKVYFLSRENKNIRQIDFTEIDLQNPGNNIMLNIDQQISDNILNDFSRYSHDLNFQLYKSAMQNIGNPISENEIEEHIRFLESFE
ncbi:MAG: linear amide C-N hydrolase [Bacteroidales bacterium]|nr:linear amide C-N hydrolase [Bacteroidales bacterium]